MRVNAIISTQPASKRIALADSIQCGKHDMVYHPLDLLITSALELDRIEQRECALNPNKLQTMKNLFKIELTTTTVQHLYYPGLKFCKELVF